MARKPVTTALPSPRTKRWLARRKAAVVSAVCCGRITLEEACRLYQRSEEKFLSWQRAFERYGVSGLRATSLKRYREGGSARLARTAAPAAAPMETVSNTAVEEASPGSFASEFSLPERC
jgi:Protein of unknown function (DUF1153)